MKGSVTSFHNIYQRYSRDVYRFAFWLCGDSDEARDIVSETFIRLWTAKTDIRLETVKAYLFKIARNLFLKRQQHFKRKAELDTNMLDPEPLPDTIFEIRSELQTIKKAMRLLPEIDRAALVMRAKDGLTYQEISRVLSISVSAVKVKVHRARLKLVMLASQEEEKVNENY